MAKTFVWVAFTNLDLFEGRGKDVPHAVCELEATAIRQARSIYVQGTNGPVKKFELIDVDGVPHIPLECVRVIPPIPDDLPEQATIDQRRGVLQRLKALGAADADIDFLKAELK